MKVGVSKVTLDFYRLKYRPRYRPISSVLRLFDAYTSDGRELRALSECVAGVRTWLTTLYSCTVPQLGPWLARGAVSGHIRYMYIQSYTR